MAHAIIYLLLAFEARKRTPLDAAIRCRPLDAGGEATRTIVPLNARVIAFVSPGDAELVEHHEEPTISSSPAIYLHNTEMHEGKAEARQIGRHGELRDIPDASHCRRE